MATMNISLPDQMKAWVEEQVASGRYANSSDFIRDILRKEQSRERMYAELLKLAEEGLASGLSNRTPEQIREQVLAEWEAADKADVL
jgi:antitoxin ParD1/3/4